MFDKPTKSHHLLKYSSMNFYGILINYRKGVSGYGVFYNASFTGRQAYLRK